MRQSRNSEFGQAIDVNLAALDGFSAYNSTLAAASTAMAAGTPGKFMRKKSEERRQAMIGSAAGEVTEIGAGTPGHFTRTHN